MFSPTLKTNSSGTHGMSRLPQNLTNATALFSTSIDHCLDHFESLEFAQAQLREKKAILRHYSLANQRFLRSVIGIHGWVDVRTVDDVMAMKPKFLASMSYHIFLTMVLRARVSPL